MRFLLDTAPFLWLTSGDLDSLSHEARQTLEGKDISLYLSSASIWEIAIKHSLKRLELTLSPKEMVAELRKTDLITLLEIKPEHAAAVAELPFHHKDPFDRLLIAQAEHEDLPIVTPDPIFRKYGIEVLW